MDSKLHRDTGGASFVEFTVAFPVVMLLTLGLVDGGLLAIDYAQVHKATYAGARQAAISDPIVGPITWSYKSGALTGNACYDSNGNATGDCTTVVNSRCTATAVSNGLATAGSCCTPSGTTCTGAVSWGTKQIAGFNKIFSAMTRAYITKPLDPRQVQISYQTTNLGFVGQPSGNPLNVTVSARCLTHEFFFLGALMGWVFPSLPAECNGIPAPAGLQIPSYSSTLSGEDLNSYNNL